jgi:hypothetical protein
MKNAKRKRSVWKILYDFGDPFYYGLSCGAWAKLAKSKERSYFVSSTVLDEDRDVLYTQKEI